MIPLNDFTFSFFTGGQKHEKEWQPAQCSGLRIPGDGEPWWAAIYMGQTESDTTEVLLLAAAVLGTAVLCSELILAISDIQTNPIFHPCALLISSAWPLFSFPLKAAL